MKKIAIPVILFVVIAVGSIVFGVSISYRKVQYQKDAVAHVFVVNEDGGELVAEYNGVTTKVLGQNVDRVFKAIKGNEMEYLFSRPKYNNDTAIKLKFSDGATYEVAHDNPEEDSVFVIYNYKGKNYFIRIKGYNSFSWLERAISPQGIYNENEIIN